ncbi:hypothetical protein [Streptomyces sp. NPDC004266]|uniref:Lsr2 family DNA-binding protein n=1 Tax=Streptomyces sp. NPDC004266 TaxID=3364693 RepID=UPI00368B5CD9
MPSPITPTARPQAPSTEVPDARPVGERLADGRQDGAELSPAPPPTAPAPPVTGPGGPSSAELRAWGRGQGFDVPDRGRLPSELLRAWERATEEAGERAE